MYWALYTYHSAMAEKLFITGSAGCIGHYLLDRFVGNPAYELHLLLREKSRLKFDAKLYSNIIIHRCDMSDIETLSDVLSEMDYVVHIATSWGDSEQVWISNVDKTLALFALCTRAKRIVYFSTASILGPGNLPIAAAGEFGSGYVRSKYKAYALLPESPAYERIVTVFPTMVFGGDKTHPYSHISEGVVPNLRYLKWLRFFDVDVSFHFMHAVDLATMVEAMLFKPLDKKAYVLGHPVVTAREVFRTLGQVFGVSIPFHIRITSQFVFVLCKWFRIKLGTWEKYLIENPHFEYDVVRPEDFGYVSALPTLKALLVDIKEQAGA